MPTSQQPKLIAFVANTDWYLYNFRLDLILAARAKGWEPLLICPAGPYVQMLQDRGLRVEVLDLGNEGMALAREPRVLFHLLRIVRRERPDVLHLFTLKCVLYGCLASLFCRPSRVLAAVTGMGYLFTSSGWKVSLLRAPVLIGTRLVIGLSDAAVVFQNTTDRDEFLARKLVRRNKTHVIRGSGVDCEKFDPKHVDTVPECHPTRLLFAARLLREKGIVEYLAAVEQLKAEGLQFESWIAGTPYLGNPSSLTADDVKDIENNSHHRYVGHCDNMVELLSQIDIVVLPSYREGTPKGLLEASAMRRVVVTTDIPGCHGVVIDSVNGFLVEPHSTQSLVDGIRRALSLAPEAREQMGLDGRELMLDNFSMTTVNAQTIRLYG